MTRYTKGECDCCRAEDIPVADFGDHGGRRGRYLCEFCATLPSIDDPVAITAHAVRFILNKLERRTKKRNA